jgi:hypothetical protein
VIPARPRMTMMFDGIRKKLRSFDNSKNMALSGN